MRRLIRSFLKLLKNNLVTALPQQFSQRLTLGTSWLSLRQPIEVITAKLAALVRMNHHPVLGPSALHRHHQHVQRQHQLGDHGGLH